jgi:hypothetical protein
MFSKIPISKKVSTTDEPPKLIRGKGMPVTGIKPVTAAILIKACKQIKITIAEPNKRPKKL